MRVHEMFGGWAKLNNQVRKYDLLLVSSIDLFAVVKREKRIENVI